MKSWKTTLCGALAALAGYLSTIKDPPWLSTVAEILLAASTAGLGFFARDNKVTSEQAGAVKLPGALLLLPLGLLAGLLCAGCASVRQTATTTTTNPTNGLVTVTKADSSIIAWGDAKNAVDKVRASAGKTSSVGASGVTEETTSGAVQAMLQAILNAAVELGKAQATGK